ncbi:MAG TPA: protease pro-enzyme activation domain-containing protein [Dokdonella sp.]
MKQSTFAPWGEPARRFALSLVAACALSAALAVAAEAPASRSPQLAQVPAAVAAGQAALIAPLDGARRMKLAINLTVRNQAALDSLIQQIYNPVSPLYHHYLSVAEFTEQFSPTQSDYDAVVNWATAQGFTVRRTTSNRHIVDIEGTVDVVNSALHVQMESYRHPSEARTFFAPDREPAISLAVPVLQFTGLDNFTLPEPKLKQGDGSMRLGPIVHAGGSGPSGNFLPSDMRAAYYGSGPLTGAGQTVGVFSFEGYNSEDVGLFYSLTGETPHDVPISNVLVNGFSGECGDCDDGEQVLDIVNVIGMAPGISQLLFYEGDSGPDVLNQMATDNAAKVLSCSWGSSDMGHVADPIYQQFQAQGQTFANATGDSGSYNGSSWLPPSANAYTLEVGGTDLTVSGPGGSWTGESAWSDSGGGFYAPAGYATPDYQLLPGVITATNLGSTAWRNDPDVSAEANFDNPTVIDGQLALGYGGTSFAAPRWSGFIALVNEQSIANGGAPVGFVNPAIYAIGVGADVANDFHDPASGSNGGFHAVAGYDLVTGWGSPNSGLVGALAGSTTTPGFVLSGYPANPSLTPDGSATTAVTVNVLNGFADPVTLSTSALPSGLTATFDPVQTTTSSTLTFSADATAAIGTTSVTITGTSADLTQTTTLSVLVGNAPAAQVTPATVTFGAVVPLGAQQQRITVSNAENSIPLTYSVVVSAQSTPGLAGSSCSGGAVAWLAASSGGTVNGGQTGGIDVAVAPAGTLPIGTYAASICITTNDTTQPLIIVPVDMTIIAGPQSDTIFESGFESGETGTPTTGTFTFDVDQPVDDSVAGSALDLATGNYHGFNSTVDNFNPYDDGSGLLFYWYDDQLSSPFSHEVGGVVGSNGKYSVLQSGATIGPGSTFSRDSSTASDASNWRAGTDGYLGVAFRNSLTHQLNYGYIHMTTTSPHGFPVQVLDYGFDNTGAAIIIP